MAIFSISSYSTASRWPSIVDLYLRHLHHSTANILRPTSLTVTVRIIAGDSTYLAAIFAPFPPFFGQQAVGLRRSLPPPFPPLPGPSIETGTNPWLPSIAFFGDGHANSCRAIYLLSRVHVYLPKTVSAQPTTLFTCLAVLWS